LPFTAHFPTFGPMSEAKLRQALAAGVLAIAVFNTLSALSQPARDRPPALWLVALWAALLLAHAAGYWYGNRLRGRLGNARYVAGQTALVFALGVTGAFFPVSVALYLALTTYTVVIAGERWGSLAITLGAIGVFAVNAMITSNLYQGSTAGLMLAAAGLAGHAIAALVRRDRPVPVSAPVSAAMSAAMSAPVSAVSGEFGLTPREAEILAALSHGARNSEIATQFGIAERTVKAHLARIYDKLGVDSRAAAIAMAVRAENGGSNK
jgi:DNA-binding CsgD family transcriptional regulator